MNSISPYIVLTLYLVKRIYMSSATSHSSYASQSSALVELAKTMRAYQTLFVEYQALIKSHQDLNIAYQHLTQHCSHLTNVISQMQCQQQLNWQQNQQHFATTTSQEIFVVPRKRKNKITKSKKASSREDSTAKSC